MKIRPSKAGKRLLSNPRLELIYKEAVANALDAGASMISIKIRLNNGREAASYADCLSIVVEDNGEGFTDENYSRFAELLDTEDEYHKGIGRLTYLCYFSKVLVESYYGGVYKREFVFDDDFEGANTPPIQLSEKHECGTTLRFQNCWQQKVWSLEYLRPKSIRETLLREFLPRLLDLKAKQQALEISISLEIENEDEQNGLVNESATLRPTDAPDMEECERSYQNGLTSVAVKIQYSIQQNVDVRSSLYVLVNVDNRTIVQDVIKAERLPKGVRAIFLLSATEAFTGISDNARQELDITSKESLKQLMEDVTSELLAERIPEIKRNNQKTIAALEYRYPHLAGMFRANGIGLFENDKILERARQEFFRKEKKVLTANFLTREVYDAAAEQASRTLMEYILYRNFIIRQLESVDSGVHETDIHNIIVPRYETYLASDFINVIYRNNAWLIDDRFMQFSAILSEKDMTELMLYINENSSIKDDGRPDIAFVFSDDVAKDDVAVEVVVVELKKRDTDVKDTLHVINQLRERAQLLGNYYGKKIRRIWLYGIIDIPENVQFDLEDQKWFPLYSTGLSYYKSDEVLVKKLLPSGAIDMASRERIPVAMTLISYSALIGDAKERNEVFMDVLRESIKKNSMM